MSQNHSSSTRCRMSGWCRPRMKHLVLTLSSRTRICTLECARTVRRTCAARSLWSDLLDASAQRSNTHRVVIVCNMVDYDFTLLLQFLHPFQHLQIIFCGSESELRLSLA